MKRLTTLALILLCAGALIPARSLDLKTILKDAAEKAGSSTSGTSGLGDIIGGLLSTDKITVASMTGSWKYSAPAVKFKSDNLLKKAGGAAATKVIEDKLAPYYNTVGINNMTLEIKSDSTFAMKVRGITLSGTIEDVTDANSDANFTFKFKAIKKISVGSLNTYVTKSANGTLDITFDVSKLVTLLQKISSLTNNSTISSVSSLLSSYDGVCAGFRVTSASSN